MVDEANKKTQKLLKTFVECCDTFGFSVDVVASTIIASNPRYKKFMYALCVNYLRRLGDEWAEHGMVQGMFKEGQEAFRMINPDVL